MPNDLMNEFGNLSLSRTLPKGQITPELIETKSKSLYFAHQARIEYLKQMGEVYSRTHKEVARQEDYEQLLAAMEEANSFKKIGGRQGYAGFENVPDNIYIHRNFKDQYTWVTGHIKKCIKLGQLHVDRTLNITKESLDIEAQLDEADEFVWVLRSRALVRDRQ